MHTDKMPVPYGSNLHIPPTNYILLAAQKEPYKEPSSTKIVSLNKESQKNGPLAENDKTERAREMGR